MTILMALFVGAAHGFECVAPVELAQLQATLAAADEASVALDEQAFRDRVNEAAGLQLPCLSAAVPPELAAHHHRVMALHLLSIGDEPGARAALTAAKASDAAYVFPDDLLPPNHPLRQHYESVDPSAATRKVPEPRSGSIAFDGQNSRKRPKLHPTVAQMFDAQGQATSTTYLAPRDPLPAYRAIPRKRNVLILSSASALVISSTMYGLAWAERGSMFDAARDPLTPAETLNAKRDRTNGLVVASGAFFGVSVGTGLAAALIGER